jgi:uncharacterized RDD family membrane protein YckC
MLTDRTDETLSYASLLRRLLAFGVDYFVIASYLALFTFLGSFVMPTGVMQFLFAGPTIGQASAFLLVTLPVILYFALMESSSWCATLGKRILRISVRTTELGRPTLSSTLGRSVLKFLPWELSHTCLWRIPGWPLAPEQPSWLVYAGFGLVWVLVAAYLLGAVFSDRRQTLYDRLSGCMVVRVTKIGTTSHGLSA